MNIKKILQSGEVVRYHNHCGIDKQPLSSHQWGVALIVQHIYPVCSKNLLLAALVHDAAEYHTGDLPAPVKWSNPELKASLDAMEEGWLIRQGANIVLNTLENQVLGLADKFEGMWFCINQMKNGHQAARRPFRLWKRAVENMLGSITQPLPGAVSMLEMLTIEKEKWDVSER